MEEGIREQRAEGEPWEDKSGSEWGRRLNLDQNWIGLELILLSVNIYRADNQSMNTMALFSLYLYFVL